MKKRSIKLLSLLLALAMVLPMLSPIGAFAVGEESEADGGSVIGSTAKFVGFPFLFSDPENKIADQVMPEGGSLPELVTIIDSYDSGSELFYKVDAAEGYTWPEAYADYHYVKATALEIVSTGEDKQVEITVSEGTIPEGAALETKPVEDPTAVENAIIGVDSLLEDSYKLFAYDIKLMQDNTAIQPDGTLTLTLSGIVDPAWSEPYASVIHLLDSPDAIKAANESGTLRTSDDEALLASHPDEVKAAEDAGVGSVVAYTLLVSDDRGVVINMDGSISFAVDSFSEFHILAGYIGYENNGYGNSGFQLNNNDKHTFYVEPGHTLRFNRNVSWISTTPVIQGVTANDYTVTIGTDAQVGSQVTYTASWGRVSAEVTIIVASRKQILEEQVLVDNRYPVVLSIVYNRTTIPSEPGNTSGSYVSLTGNYAAGVFNQEFASSANGYIDPSIADVLIKTIYDNSNTIGVADSTGAICLKYLYNIKWNSVLDLAVTRQMRALDGTQLNEGNKDEYKVIPYVIKLMDGNNRGWHIDCAIVPKTNVTLAYDINLDNYTVPENIFLPPAATGKPTFVPTIGSIEYDKANLPVNGQVAATYGDAKYTLTFKGWNTSPDGTGTMYNPGDTISITEDTTLYAIWEGATVPGDLYVYKDVTKAEGVGEKDDTYSFTVTLNTSQTTLPTVAIYGSDGAAKADAVSTVTPDSKNGVVTVTFALKDGEHAVIKGINANTSYTVVEAEGEYQTSSTGAAGTIPSGGQATTYFTNHYPYVVADLTIVKNGGEADSLFTFKVVNTAKNINMTVVVPANGLVTIKNLPVGTYTVTEDTKWSYRYECTCTDENPITLEAGKANTLTFTNKLTKDKWLGGEDVAQNIFTGTTDDGTSS